MDKNVNNNATQNQNSSMLDYGRWVPLDESQLGFKLPPLPTNQPVAGPDGSLYCVGDSKPELSPVGANSVNAVPTPSSIVQMPAIVQPIALVPYTSQNQPMLQYDPYSRPVEPEGAPKAPTYIKKPYRVISLTAFIIAIASLLVFLLFSVAAFQANSARDAFKASGLSFIKAMTDVIKSTYSTDYGLVVLEKKGGDILSRIIVSALPFISLVVVIIFLVLVIKYLIRFFKKKSPRSFSVLAFINIILIILMFVGLLLMSNAEVAADARSANTRAFFALEASPATIMGKWALGFSLVASILLFILPFFARKNAYMIERDDPARKTYVISEE